jgi:hypothetical protein
VARSHGLRVRNVHERRMSAPRERVGELLDSLSGSEDRLWPFESWPPMRLRPSLRVGAVGGHGPIRYRVEDYEAGVRVTFGFTGPRGFHGTHRFEVVADADCTILRHRIDMRATGMGLLSWPLVFGPLHDALIEDCLDKAEGGLKGETAPHLGWSRYVRILRAVVRLVQGRRRRRESASGDS